MAEIECYTMNSPPTHVVWLRNGEEIEPNESYETLQVVVDRRNSHYRNILVVRDVLGVMNVSYTCNISNSAGSTQHNVTIDLPGILLAYCIAIFHSFVVDTKFLQLYPSKCPLTLGLKHQNT